MNDCIFCKIIEGEIPSYKVFENDFVVAFLDITQGTKGHTLIVPKTHVRNIYDVDQQIVIEVFKVVPIIANALKNSLNPIGLNIVNNNDQPLQSVFHFHVHLIPRYENDGVVFTTTNNFGVFKENYFEQLTNDVKEAIKKELK